MISPNKISTTETYLPDQSLLCRIKELDLNIPVEYCVKTSPFTEIVQWRVMNDGRFISKGMREVIFRGICYKTDTLKEVHDQCLWHYFHLQQKKYSAIK